MSKTKRIYNNPKSGIFWHPYHPCCMGKCPFCKDHRLDVRRRQARKAEVRQQAKMVIGKVWLGDRYLTWFDEDGIGVSPFPVLEG